MSERDEAMGRHPSNKVAWSVLGLTRMVAEQSDRLRRVGDEVAKANADALALEERIEACLSL